MLQITPIHKKIPHMGHHSTSKGMRIVTPITYKYKKKYIYIETTKFKKKEKFWPKSCVAKNNCDGQTNLLADSLFCKTFFGLEKSC